MKCECESKGRQKRVWLEDEVISCEMILPESSIDARELLEELTEPCGLICRSPNQRKTDVTTHLAKPTIKNQLKIE